MWKKLVQPEDYYLEISIVLTIKTNKNFFSFLTNKNIQGIERILPKHRKTAFMFSYALYSIHCYNTKA